MGRDAPVLGAELGLWERAGSSASWWLVDLPSPVALPSHPVCHGRGGGNGLHGPPWALPLEHSSLPPGGPEACQGDLHIPTFPHSPSRPSEFHPKLVTSKLRWDPRNLKAEFWAAIASGQDTAMSSAHTWEPPPHVVRPATLSACLFLGFTTAAWKLRRQTLGRGPWHQPRVSGTPMFAKKAFVKCEEIRIALLKNHI